jgi:hypothetical protein
VDEKTLNAALSSVLVREKEIFAANSYGLFRATLKGKRWSRMLTPEGMPMGGSFATTPRDSKHLLYFATLQPIVNALFMAGELIDKDGNRSPFGILLAGGFDKLNYPFKYIKQNANGSYVLPGLPVGASFAPQTVDLKTGVSATINFNVKGKKADAEDNSFYWLQYAQVTQTAVTNGVPAKSKTTGWQLDGGVKAKNNQYALQNNLNSSHCERKRVVKKGGLALQ